MSIDIFDNLRPDDIPNLVWPMDYVIARKASRWTASDLDPIAHLQLQITRFSRSVV